MSNLMHFLKVDIWRVQRDEVSAVRFFFYKLLKMLLLTVEWFLDKKMFVAAASLTYSTLLAIVPIIAVVFAIARGFGYNIYIEQWFRDSLSSQPQAAEIIISFVNSYLIHTKSGVFLGIGLLFMLWTVIMLIDNIEQVFNDIWQVNKPRSIYRTITDYTSMFFLAPIGIVVTSGLTIAVTSFAGNNLSETYVLGPLLRFLIDLTPFLLMSAVFVFLYIFMPNTKVNFSSAIVPGILAGCAMQGLQFAYIHSQIWVTGYNAIYGSFAALPLFLLWLQISWIICLFGANLCYTNQNLEDFAFRTNTSDLSHRYKLMLSLLLASRICKRFEEGERPYTALELKLQTGIPIRMVHDLLNELVELNVISEVNTGDKGDDTYYQPAISLDKLSVRMVVDRIEAKGKWKLDLDMHQFEGEAWSKTFSLRAEFLKKSGEVLVKDL
jgi:membrane protein